MKTIEEIERDVEFQILDKLQTDILFESTRDGVECSQYVKDWNANIIRMDELKKQGCKREKEKL